MEDTNQADNEKNGEDETESTCDKDEGVTEKSEEEVSSPPVPCKANCLSLMFFVFGDRIEFIPACYNFSFFLLFVFPVATHSEGCEQHVGRYAIIIINPVTISSKATVHASVRGEWFP